MSGKKEQGQILFTAVLGLIVILGMLMFTALTLHSNSQSRTQQWAYHGMAVNMAQAGITETLSWMRRNPNADRFDGNARVFEFIDVCDEPTHSQTRINDIDDPAFKRTPTTCDNGHNWITPSSLNPYIGLVKEIKLTTDLYGRFEVWDDDMEDITQEGELWKVRSIGILCKKKYSDSNFHGVLGEDLIGLPPSDPVAPEVVADANEVQVLASVVMGAEFRKLDIKIPVAALLISANHGTWIDLNDKIRLIGPGGQGSAVQYQSGTGPASESSGVEIQGFSENRTNHSGQDFTCDVNEIFGVDKKTLAALSDVNADDFSQIPIPIPDMSLVYLEGDANFTTASPLQGSGVLFVDGNITLTGSGHSFSGMIVTTGTFTNAAITTVFGSIIAGLDLPDNGSQTAISLSGLGADFSEFYYDPVVLQDVATFIGVYRMSRSPYVIKTETLNADGITTNFKTWLYGYDREGDRNKNKVARKWIPGEYQ